MIQVEIWSDVMCPFCYIGKRNFEKALEQFPQRHDVTVEWKSFQLNPNLKTDPSKNVNEFLAEHKGISLEQARQMNDRVTALANDAGLIYDFDKAIVANSFDAHRLSHMAKRHGKQDAMEERLFKAYFTEGKNTADHETLKQLGEEVGLDRTEISIMLSGKDFAEDVSKDIYEARQVGARGVPFFVFDNRYSVSGAQPTIFFLNALNTIVKEGRDN